MSHLVLALIVAVAVASIADLYGVARSLRRRVEVLEETLRQHGIYL